MARKGWDQLSPTYRRRLQKSGIDETRYILGASLAKARGHTSTERENKERRFYRKAQRELGQYFDKDEIKDVVDEIGLDEADAILDARHASMNSEGFEKELAKQAMRLYWGQYTGSIPKEWLYYHGA